MAAEFNISERDETSKRSGWIVLSVIVAVMTIVWLGVLPLLSQHPSIRSVAKWQEAHGIDPAAMFYSDVPAVGDAERKFETLQKEHPDALWHWGQ